MHNLIEDSNFESSSKPVLNFDRQHGFNYTTLDRQTQIEVKQKTSEIKSLIRQTAQDIFYVGQKLAEVKQQLKHGEFRNWLKTEFNWSISSATKFMQVSEQFKSVNFTHLNFATSALYVLAAPSTPEKAREQALQLASKGENITYSLAKVIIKHHKKSENIEIYTQSPPNQTEMAGTDPQVVSEISNVTPKVAATKSYNSVRIIKIKQEHPQDSQNRIQEFEIVYANTCIAVKGSPEDLTVLFEKMQNNPQFTQDIFRQARSLSN